MRACHRRYRPSRRPVVAVGGGGQVDDAAVHPHPVDRLEHLGFRDIAGGQQEPHAVPLHEIGFALAVVGQHLGLVG
ncbi:hypothetical protein GCM10009736_45780 [Actinomadura bangladeshensis]